MNNCSIVKSFLILCIVLITWFTFDLVTESLTEADTLTNIAGAFVIFIYIIIIRFLITTIKTIKIKK